MIKKVSDCMNKDNNYIVKIGDITDNIKNITIEAFLNDLKKFELKDTIVIILDLEDVSGKINGLLIADRDDESAKIIDTIIAGKEYQIRGNIFKMNDGIKNDFYNFTNKSIENYIVSSKILFVKSIKQKY